MRSKNNKKTALFLIALLVLNISVVILLSENVKAGVISKAAQDNFNKQFAESAKKAGYTKTIDFTKPASVAGAEKFVGAKKVDGIITPEAIGAANNKAALLPAKTAEAAKITDLAGGKSMTGNLFDMIKTIGWGGGNYEYPPGIPAVAATATTPAVAAVPGTQNKVSGWKVLVKQCINERVTCFFTVISQGLAIGDLADLVFKTGEKRFGTGYAEDSIGSIENCEKCDDDEFLPCTAERCEMIGLCDHEPATDNTEVLCIPKECDQGDVKLDKLTAGWERGNITTTTWTAYEKSSSYSATTDKNILKLDKNLPYKITSIKVEVETNLFSKCKYGIDETGRNKGYDDLTNVLGTGEWAKYHESEIALPSDIGRGQEHKLYIECENICGTKREKGYDDYRVEFEFEDIPELDPPVIHQIDPNDVYFYPSTLKEVVITIPLSENGYCRYSTSKGNESLTDEFDNMIIMSGQAHPDYASGLTSVKKAECKQNEKCAMTTKNACTNCYVTLDLTKGYDEINWSTDKYGELEGINSDIATRAAAESELSGTISKMYLLNLKCSDNGKNGVADYVVDNLPNDDNIMTDSELYMFKTAEPYTITIEQPKGDVDEKSFALSINTTRTTKCRYIIDNETSWDEMMSIDQDIMSESHEATITGVNGGDHTLYAQCRDIVNLLQTAKQPFHVVTDITPPKIVRAYHTADFEPLLTIKTNEDASCVYSTDKKRKCNFEFTETELTGVYGMQESFDKTEHNALWSSSQTYYIKCKDWKGIAPIKGLCSENGIIQPYSVLEEF